MDKNIAALLRSDTRTVEVRFQQDVRRDMQHLTGDTEWSPKTYKYVTDLAVKVGDFVIVEAAGKITIAAVFVVHDSVDIKPNEDAYYKWVMAILDTSHHQENKERNAEIEKTVSDAYRVNLRRSYAQQILAGVEDADKEKLTKLLGGA